MSQQPISLSPARIYQQPSAHHRDRALTNSGRLSCAKARTFSNRLAHYPRGSGAGHETLAGLRFHPSIEFVIAALAVWKTGVSLPLIKVS